MPIYEYRCAECGAHKEILQRISDAPLTDCPECGKPALKKLVSAAGFQLKGTGWYVTDFRDKGTKPAAKGDKAEKSGTTDKPADSAKPAETAAKETPKTESSSPAKTAAEKA
jgi:putative FmdB family regulatory protein